MAIKKIVIAGGGTAGWMAASLLHHRWASKGIQIVLVESPNIGIIGVGEGSTPSLRHFFAELGISDEAWMPECNATYKVNIEFEGWSPQSGIPKYSHPFISQVDVFSEKHFHINCLTRRLGLDVETQPEKFLLNGWLAAQNKQPHTPANFPFVVEYGYHFDSALLGQFLAKRAVACGVQHIQDNIEQVKLDAQGDIQALDLGKNGQLEADFFIDCTGFDSLLLQSALGVEFIPFSDNLFANAAIAMPSPALDLVPVQTKATALSHGWAWQIPLTHRTGNGYVFSTKYYSHEQAEHELREHLGLQDPDIPVKYLNMKVGRVAKHWHRNCLAIGLSQGFIEPLEATALHLTQTSINTFMQEYEAGEFSAKFEARCNQQISDSYERVRDYIVAHYKLNTRDDSQYWRDNRNNTHLSDALWEVLKVWYQRGDLSAEIKKQKLDEHFNITSWHCLLAGYGAFPTLGANQPGTGDHYIEAKLEQFFKGCMLNFN